MFADDTGVVTVVDADDQTSTAGASQVDGTDQGDAGQDGATASGGGDASTDAAAQSTPTESIEDKIARLERKLEGTARGYDDQRSSSAQILNENKLLREDIKSLKDQLTQATAPRPLTQEEWADLYSDPQKGEQYIDARAERKASEIAEKIFDQRMGVVNEQNRVNAEFAIEAQARKAVGEFAKSIHLTPDDFSDLHARNPFLNDIKPREYQKAAIAVMKGEYADRVAKVIPERAAQQARDAQSGRIKNSAVSASVPVNAGRSELTPSQEFMAMLREHAKVSDI